MEEKCRSNRKQTFQKKIPGLCRTQNRGFSVRLFFGNPFPKKWCAPGSAAPRILSVHSLLVFLRQSQEISPDKAYSQNEGILLQTYSPTGKSRGFSLFCVR